uniref:Serine/threonine-protein phosphatase 4 regulatory subunit 2 n=1 Tax=Kalanchoe fedtschenkoi TaxID=63787 RepID=A0A7N0VL36_KALFE
MDASSSENVETAVISSEVNQLSSPIVPPSVSQGGLLLKNEVNEEEVSRTLELIASTGRFWCDWEHLRNLLSYKLKQVLSEYPEASMNDDQQIFSLGETFPELVNRLENELHNFTDGAPFTLQRICEILLAARSIYSKLPKLVLALEKNLLVTSTLAVSTDPPPSVMSSPGEQTLVEPEKESEEGCSHLISLPNGVEPTLEVKDEIMAEVEEGDADVHDEMTIDTEAHETKTEASNVMVNPNSNL